MDKNTELKKLVQIANSESASTAQKTAAQESLRTVSVNFGQRRETRLGPSRNTR